MRIAGGRRVRAASAGSVRRFGSRRRRGSTSHAASASTSTSTSSSERQDRWAELRERMRTENTGERAARQERIGRELLGFVNEATSAVLATGSSGARRAVRASLLLPSIIADCLPLLQNSAEAGGSAISVAASEAIAYRALRLFMERMGGVYIKLGQFVASSPSVFPAALVKELELLLDKAAPMPRDIVMQTIRQELEEKGLRLEDELEDISAEPIASASVAQVHAARLRKSGKDVVLKVQRPEAKENMGADMTFVVLSLKLLEILQPELKRTSVVGILEDVQRTMVEECDFVKEAENVRAFQRYLDANGIDCAKAPFVYEQYTSTRLLVMERLRGAALTDLEAITRVTRGKADPSTVVVNALNTWMGSVLLADSFHADVHAGNLLVLQDGRIGFIDFGIVGRIPQSTMSAVQTFLIAAGEGDPDAMARAMASMGATGDDVDVAALSIDLRKVLRGLFSVGQTSEVTVKVDGLSGSLGASVELDEQEINSLVIDVIEMGETHGLKFPREFGLLLKQLLYFDRYTTLLAPELTLSDERVDAWRRAGRLN